MLFGSISLSATILFIFVDIFSILFIQLFCILLVYYLFVYIYILFILHTSIEFSLKLPILLFENTLNRILVFTRHGQTHRVVVTLIFSVNILLYKYNIYVYL